MMKNLLLFLIFLIFSKTTPAQSLEREVIASSGDFAESTQSSLSSTIGESTILLGFDLSNILTQGFQQPNNNPTIPTEFGEFSALKQGKFVRLDWFTYSERNSLRFDIERSGDAKSFSKITETKALGQNATRHNYDALDKSPIEGINYYRLRQIDLDGQEKLSKTISVNFENSTQQKNWARVYPTLVQESVVIECKFNNDAQLTVANILAIPLSHLSVSQSENPFQITFSMRDFPTGTYFFIFKTRDTHNVQKIIKQ